MYGAGKLLLKDTMLEMKANRRYGVVGHNGSSAAEEWGALFLSRSLALQTLGLVLTETEGKPASF